MKTLTVCVHGRKTRLFDQLHSRLDSKKVLTRTVDTFRSRQTFDFQHASMQLDQFLGGQPVATIIIE
jgi:hypothetical protein